MARLIDADALELRVEKFEQLTGMKLDIVHDFVGSAPTIDAVNVVRCKDCKWSEPNEFDDYDCRCHIPTFRVNANGFCSYGERKESE